MVKRIQRVRKTILKPFKLDFIMLLKFCSLILFLQETENPLIIELISATFEALSSSEELYNCFAYIPLCVNLPCDVSLIVILPLRRKQKPMFTELKVLKQDFYHRCMCFHKPVSVSSTMDLQQLSAYPQCTSSWNQTNDSLVSTCLTLGELYQQ